MAADRRSRNIDEITPQASRAQSERQRTDVEIVGGLYPPPRWLPSASSGRFPEDGRADSGSIFFPRALPAVPRSSRRCGGGSRSAWPPLRAEEVVGIRSNSSDSTAQIRTFAMKTGPHHNRDAAWRRAARQAHALMVGHVGVNDDARAFHPCCFPAEVDGFVKTHRAREAVGGERRRLSSAAWESTISASTGRIKERPPGHLSRPGFQREVRHAESLVLIDLIGRRGRYTRLPRRPKGTPFSWPLSDLLRQARRGRHDRAASSKKLLG